MKCYEMVREIPNSCKNNQMRDVFIEEIFCDDPERYAKSLFLGQQCAFEVERRENGDAEISVQTGGIRQRLLFTLIEP